MLASMAPKGAKGKLLGVSMRAAVSLMCLHVSETSHLILIPHLVDLFGALPSSIFQNLRKKPTLLYK